MTSDYISGICLAEGCTEIARELVYMLSSGSIESAIETGLQSLAETSFQHAEEGVQRQLRHDSAAYTADSHKSAVPAFSAVARMFAAALRLSSAFATSPPAASPQDSVSSFSHSSVSGGTPTPVTSLQEVVSLTPVTSLQEKVSLAITDSDPYVLQVTSCEDVAVEPLLKEVSPRLHSKSPFATNVDDNSKTRRKKRRSKFQKRHSRCDIYTIIALSLVTVAFTCASMVTALTLNSEQTYTWFMVLFTSFLVQILVLEPLKSVIKFIVCRKK